MGKRINEVDHQRGYRYKFEFKNASVLEDFIFNTDDKLSPLRSLGVEWKHPLPQ